MAPHVQAAVAQAKMAQPFGQAQQISTGGRPQVIQGKFPGGFTDLGQRIRQAGVIQPKFRNSSMQLPPALASFQPGGRGRPLPVLVQAKMEAVFGTSFSDVRIHEDPAARQLGAQAFTMGSHIYFAPGQFNTARTQGMSLLGQQLAHVVQQRAGRGRNPFGSGVAVVQDPGMESEAARMGKLASRATPATLQGKKPQTTASTQQRTLQMASLRTQPAPPKVTEYKRPALVTAVRDAGLKEVKRIQDLKNIDQSKMSNRRKKELNLFIEEYKRANKTTQGKWLADLNTAVVKAAEEDTPSTVGDPRKVKLIWTNPSEKKDVESKWPKLAKKLKDPVNYDAKGTPRFNNSHIDDTKVAKWKLQADVEEKGSSSQTRMHLNVEPTTTGLTVTVEKITYKTHRGRR